MQGEVLGQRELEHEAAALAVLGNVTESLVEMLRRTGVRDVEPADAHAATGRLDQPTKRVDQLRLPVAVDAGDSDDLAAADLHADAAHRLDTAVVHDVQVVDVEHDVAGTCR